jgi:hypothetical protein
MLSLLLLLAAGQGIFMSAVLLFYRRANPLPNRVLALVFLILSVDLFHIFMLNTGLYVRILHFVGIYSPLMVLIGPCIYFYIKALLDEQFRFRALDSVHLAACLLSIIRRLPFYLETGEAKVALVETVLLTSPMRMSPRGYLILFAQTGLLLAYVYFAYRYLKKHDSRNTSSKYFKVSWLKKFIRIYISYSVISLLGTILLFVFESFTVEIDNSLALVNAMILFTMGYLTLIYPEIYSGLQRRKTVTKYEKSPLRSDYATAIISRLQHLMETEKPICRMT